MSLHRTVWRRTVESLRVRLALAATVVVVACVGTTSHLVLDEVEARSELAVLDLEASNAERMAMLVNNRVVSLQNALGSVARSVPEAATRDAAAAAEFLDHKVVLATMFANVVLFNADGELLALRDGKGVRTERQTIADRAYFQQTVKENRAIVSAPILGRLSNEPIIVLTAPVRDSQGRVKAVMVGVMRLASRNLLDDLTQAGTMGTDPVLTFIADSAGRILSHPDPKKVMQLMEDEPGMATYARRWVAQGRPVEPTGSAAHLDDHFIASAGVAQTDWMVFRVAKDDALLGGVAAARASSGRIGIVVAVAGGLVMLLLLFQALRPLHRLHQHTLRLSDTGADLEVGWPQATGELGELSAALQRAMSQRVAQEMKNLVLAGQMRSLLAASPVGIVFTKDGLIQTSSDEFDRLFGYAAGALVGRRPRELYAAEADHTDLVARMREAFARGEPCFGEWLFSRRDGSQFWGRLNGRPVENRNPRAGTLWLVENVTQRREARERLSWAATHDALTRLLNRDAFEARLNALLPRVSAQAPATLLVIDLDRFKAINDNAGHAAGDAVLQEVARLLVTHVRGSDAVARLGGDEFAMLLSQCDVVAAQRIAELVREGAQAIGTTVQGQRFTIGTSIGLLELRGQHGDAASALKLADSACYEAKHAGRNTVRVAAGLAPAPPLRVVSG